MVEQFEEQLHVCDKPYSTTRKFLKSNYNILVVEESKINAVQ